MEISRDSEQEKIVEAVLGLAHSLGMAATAEGVETLPILERLIEMGCDFGQGYHFAKALPAKEAEIYCAHAAGEAFKQTVFSASERLARAA